MTFALGAICLACARWQGDVCTAFPGGVPPEVLFGQFDHRAPLYGESLLFELAPGREGDLAAWEEMVAAPEPELETKEQKHGTPGKTPGYHLLHPGRGFRTVPRVSQPAEPGSSASTGLSGASPGTLAPPAPAETPAVGEYARRRRAAERIRAAVPGLRTVDLGVATPEAAEGIAEGFERTVAKFPVVRRGVLHVRVQSNPEELPNAIGWWYDDSLSLNLSDKYFSEKVTRPTFATNADGAVVRGFERVEPLEAVYRRDAQSGFHPPYRRDHAAATVVEHELGHAMHHLAAMANVSPDRPSGNVHSVHPEDGMAMVEHYRLLAKEHGVHMHTSQGDYTKLRSPWFRTKDDARKMASLLSKYAAANWDEAVAEAFADVVENGDDAKPLSRDLTAMVDEWARRETAATEWREERQDRALQWDDYQPGVGLEVYGKPGVHWVVEKPRTDGSILVDGPDGRWTLSLVKDSVYGAGLESPPEVGDEVVMPRRGQVTVVGVSGETAAVRRRVQMMSEGGRSHTEEFGARWRNLVPVRFPKGARVTEEWQRQRGTAPPPPVIAPADLERKLPRDRAAMVDAYLGALQARTAVDLAYLETLSDSELLEQVGPLATDVWRDRRGLAVGEGVLLGRGDEATRRKIRRRFDAQLRDEYDADDVSPAVTRTVHEAVRRVVLGDARTPNMDRALDRWGVPVVWMGGKNDGQDTPSAHYLSGQQVVRFFDQSSPWNRRHSVEKNPDGPDEPPRPGTNVAPSSWEHVFRHEYGHHAESMLEESGSDLPRRWKSLWTDVSARHEADFSEAFQRGSGTREVLERDVSYYAMTNEREGFAETFAAVTSPGYDRSKWPARAQTLLDFVEREVLGDYQPGAGAESAGGGGEERAAATAPRPDAPGPDSRTESGAGVVLEDAETTSDTYAVLREPRSHQDEDQDERREAALARMFEFDWQAPDGKEFHSQIDSWSHEGQTTTIEGVVRDGRGRQVGNWERTLFFPPETWNWGLTTATPVARHVSFEIDKSVQGKGFGEAFLEHSEREYAKAGIDHVMVTAAGTVGGYAWARAGFDWNAFPKRVLENLSDFGDGDLAGVPRDVPEAIAKEADRLHDRFYSFTGHSPSETWPTPYEVAMLGREFSWTVKTGGREFEMWPGKALMLQSWWVGRKEIRQLVGAKTVTLGDVLRQRASESRDDFLARVADARRLEVTTILILQGDLGDEGVDWDQAPAVEVKHGEPGDPGYRLLHPRTRRNFARSDVDRRREPLRQTNVRHPHTGAPMTRTAIGGLGELIFLRVAGAQLAEIYGGEVVHLAEGKRRTVPLDFKADGRTGLEVKTISSKSKNQKTAISAEEKRRKEDEAVRLGLAGTATVLQVVDLEGGTVDVYHHPGIVSKRKTQMSHLGQFRIGEVVSELLGQG